MISGKNLIRRAGFGAKETVQSYGALELFPYIWSIRGQRVNCITYQVEAHAIVLLFNFHVDGRKSSR
jgi:hypothetical protein